jgi:hypothetical protein
MTANAPTDERLCDLDGCTAPTTVIARTGRYCDTDHSIAASNGWEDETLTAYDVTYAGEASTWRAPTREDAESQWRAYVRSVLNKWEDGDD